MGSVGADTQTGFTGFPRPRTEDGAWYTPPDGHYDPRSQHGFHEGTAWQYQCWWIRAWWRRCMGRSRPRGAWIPSSPTTRCWPTRPARRARNG
ncbi:glycoside hydrolase domain-containing protein [Pantoea ananatis]|uniref:glycoside hydrolase domain-containing protein n=1 Tax=Pantoea ananas TaxID=553 RepID=UPI0039B82849